MAKRKYKQQNKKDPNGNPRADWKLDDDAALVAWLDHCVKTKIDFKASVVDYLKGTRGKDFTLQQVDTKIRFIWTKCGSEQSKSKADVYQKGSDCLPYFSAEENKAISNAKEHLLRQLASGEVSSMGISLNDPRLESASRTVALESQRQSSQESKGKTALPSRRKQIEKNSFHKRQKVSGDPADGVGSSQMGRRRPESTAQLAQRSKLDRVKRSARIQAQDTATSDSEDGIQSQRQEGESVRDSRQQLQHIGGIDHLSMENLNAALWRKTRRQDARIANLFSQLQSLAKHIKDHGDCLASAINQHKKALPTYSKDQQISILQQKLTASQSAGRFITISDDPFVGVTEKEVKTCIGDIQRDIDEIIHLSSQLLPFIPANTGDVADSEWMLRRSLGLNSQSNISLESLLEKFSRISPRSVLRALIAAAVCEWIFESDFPNFEEEGSRVLAKYREHLALQDGPSILRSLDTAVHHSLINEKHFKTELIPEKAEELAIRLSQALTPFYPHELTSPLPDGFQTWGQTEEEHQERRAKVIGLFENALRLKADLILKEEEYELATPMPGALFDAASMHVDWESDTGVDSRFNGRSQIQLCLFPALFSYNDDSQAAGREEGAAMNKDLPHMTVQYRNFVQRPDAERGRARLISKAVVILEEPEPAAG